VKKFFSILLVLTAILGAGLYWLSGSLDQLLKEAIVGYGSAMTKAKISVDRVEVAPASGKGTISRLVIGNPPGFKTPYALKVERIDVDIDMASVTKDVIIIRMVAIEGPDVIYENGESMTNFDAIQNNIAKYLGPAKRNSANQDTRLIVEELTIYNAKAQASAPFMAGKTVSVPLPDISLKNIGKSKGGVTPGELGQEIAGALKAKLSVTANFDRLKKSVGESLGQVGSAVKDLFK